MALLLREADVESLATMPEAVQWVEQSLRAHGAGRARVLPRQRVKLPTGTLHVLPAADQELGVVGLKAYTSFREGARFLVLLYSAESGQLLALVEADLLGMLRTGAASGVATRYMARQDADVLAVFGSGWQARGQVEAVAAVRPLRQVRVYSRDAERRRRFAAEMSQRVGVEVVASASPEAALEGARVVCTITTARDPLFASDAVQDGTHINAAGSNSLIRRELDEKLVRRARVIAVDSRAQAPLESGDLLVPAERGWIDWALLPELSEIVSGRTPGRLADQDVTIFESHGIGLEDVAMAAHLYERARAAGVGEDVAIFTA